MRIAVALAVVTMGMAAPALAAEPAVTVADVAAPGLAAPMGTAPLVEARFVTAGDNRFTTTTKLVSTQFASDVTALRHRFASSMMEFYPIANSGFHFSSGMHMFNTTNFLREADKLTNNLLWSPSLRGSGGVRTGFKRQTPAMTVGYTRTVAQKLAVGLEAGTLMGRVNSSMRSSLGRGFSDGADDHKMNPVASLVFGMKF